MTTLNDISFHDATVLSFVKQGSDQVILELERSSDSRAVAKIHFPDVKSVSLNGLLMGDRIWLETDGEILDIMKVNDGYSVIIETYDFEAREARTLSYDIMCGALRVEWDSRQN